MIRLTLANIVEHAVVRHLEAVKRSSREKLLAHTLNKIGIIKAFTRQKSPFGPHTEAFPLLSGIHHKTAQDAPLSTGRRPSHPTE